MAGKLEQPSDMPQDELGGLTEEQILASGYSVEDYKRRLNLARETVKHGNVIFAGLKRRF